MSTSPVCVCVCVCRSLSLYFSLSHYPYLYLPTMRARLGCIAGNGIFEVCNISRASCENLKVYVLGQTRQTAQTSKGSLVIIECSHFEHF
jgi:hypothetical protein